MNPREAAKELSDRAREAKVRFPKVFDESKLMQVCGATVMIFRSGDDYDFAGALQSLIEKYGAEEDTAAPPKSTGEKKTKKRKKDESDANEDTVEAEEVSEPATKAPRKADTVVEERNRPVAEAIKEMAVIYFKNKDPRKGGVFSKGAKAIRDCETYISSAKEAMALKGIGKGIAGYVEEFLQTGSIQKLEELRAGFA